ncbi:MAG: sulfite exporter TauE/SafE family protein [Firmicutes bacterium HGW-Firmicutes-1]|jgi:hypothetical protein|nr:MAG: sulfite exporter TauE/SafE family protein [Firmicutes bacterium HGW-Firmicutes-1]
MLGITILDEFIIIGLITVFVSALIQGITGFGFALIAVPILSTFLLPKDIVPIVVIYSLLMNILMYIRKRTIVHFSELKTLIIFSSIGIPIGVYLLNLLDATIIKLVAGITIILTALALMVGWEWKGKNLQLTTAIAGLTSGVLNGSTSMSGPPIVLLLLNQKVDKEHFRAYLPAFGIITNVITIIFLMLGRNFNATQLKNMVIFSPALFCGLFIGSIAVRFINEYFFRRFSLILILVTGVYTLYSVLF